MSASYMILCVLAVFVFMILCMGLYIFTLAGHQVSAELELPEDTDKNKKTIGKLSITNNSRFPIFKLFCWLKWENQLTGEKEKEKFTFTVPGRRTSCISFQVEIEYSGVCVFQIEQAQIRDPFSLFRREISIKEEKEMLVLPDIRRMETDNLKEEAYDCESFQYSAEKRGEDPSEVFQLREYRAGDSMKQVHWKLSAKWNELMVKESSYPIYDEIMVFMETGFSEQMPPEHLDKQASLVLSVMKSLVNENVPVEFGYYDFKINRAGTLRIENEDEFWQAAIQAMRAGRSIKGVSGLKRFLEKNDGQKYAHYIYVTAGEEAPELEWLRENANITVLDWRAVK